MDAIRSAAPAAGDAYIAPRLPPPLRVDAFTRLSHELRGSLHLIVGFTELLARSKTCAVSPADAELLRDVITCAHDALAAVDDLNALAREPRASRARDRP